MEGLKKEEAKQIIDEFIKQVFQLIIIHYPKTKQTIVNLRQLMQQNEWYGRERFVVSLEESTRKSLLHIGNFF